MTKTEAVKNQCKQLRLSTVAVSIDETLANAEKEKITYLDFVNRLFNSEITKRMEKDKDKRTKLARLPLSHNLDLYDFNCENSIAPQELKQLREMKWLEQNYNVILMGPSGTGKTYIAGGLCFDAIDLGYRTYFQTMESLVKVLKMKNITKSAATEYKRIINSHMLVIDDIMLFPVTKDDAVMFFNLINELHNKTSLVITTNKSPKEWADVLNDAVLTTAILDRILYRCEIIKLTGKSYRMQNRKSFFENKKN